MKIYIGIPMYGSAEPEFINSLSKTKAVLQAMGHTVEVDIHSGCSIITKARNGIVSRFIASGFDNLLFLDSDMAWDAVDAVTVLHSPYDFAGIAYRQKKEGAPFNCVLSGKEDNGWIGATRTGAGFIVLSRRCLTEMTRQYPHLRYEDNGEHYALFDFVLKDGLYYGEDYTFCDRWVAVGGGIWLYPADIGHIGKKIYRGNIKEIL
jgi:hypothetical protein